jgi:hypothetical protein
MNECDAMLQVKSPTSAVKGAMWLLELACRAERGDRQAIAEFAARPMFHIAGRQLALPEYVTELARTAQALRLCGGNAVAIDMAQDLTIDKFSRQPLSNVASATKRRRKRGTDCRRYLRGLVRVLRHLVLEAATRQDPALDETLRRAAQRYVRRHFRLSCKEACRRMDLWSRYTWRTQSGDLLVWLPRAISGTQRRELLEQNIGPVDAGRAGERERVQRRIEEMLSRCQILSLDPDVSAVQAHGTNLMSWSDEHGLSVDGLAKATARRKLAEFPKLPRSIRALGRRRLYQLIIRIFKDLADGCFSLSKLAKAVGMSKASLSRFAGTMWDGNGAGYVPLLFRNAAGVLADYAPWVEAAKSAGVWDRVFTITETDATREDAPDGLSFFAVLIPAIPGPHATTKLGAAFTIIETWAGEIEHSQAYQNFLRFMAASRAAAEAAGAITPSGPSMPKVGADAGAANDSGLAPFSDAGVSEGGSLRLFRNGEPCCTLVTSRQTTVHTFRRAKSGHYALVDSTNHPVWEADLGPEHLRWRDAFPNAPLPMAAATSPVAGSSSVSLMLELPGINVQVRIFPGLESGRIEMTTSAPSSTKE